MRERLHLGVVEPVLEHRHEGLVYQRRFAASADSADAYEHSQRKVHIHILEVVASRSSDSERQAVSFAPLCRNLYRLPAQQIVKGGRFSCYHPAFVFFVSFRALKVRNQFLQRCRQAYASAFLTGSRADVNQPVRRHHGLCIVLHHHDRIAFVAKFLQGDDQFPVVPLVKSDARFVEDVEHIDELGAYLCGKPDSLALSS